MKSEDIIEGLNLHIKGVRIHKNINATGHVVLQKVIIPYSKFKAYKLYKYTLWFVNGGNSYKVFEIENTERVINGQEENIDRKMNILLSNTIFNWIGTIYYEEVINGEYKGL